ncbi:hypothetical protein Enr13x_53030 [Stieleria neptunia]|uniref:Uncharacterized protein n=1 Tax=Stieleria neptunia TaxID=2527979 RepID=A0A518HXE7_9BACT|nr:hypothetical protein Enr13x_53030 [Stieleria neptunia]
MANDIEFSVDADSVPACASGWFSHPATTTVRAIAADGQCTRSESPWGISLPLLYRFHFGVGMKPGRLAQCLPVVSATGIERTDLLRPGRPAQWVSRSTRSPGIVSARWALSIPLNPPPVADATGRHSTGPPGLKAVLVLSTAVLVLLLDSTGVGLSSSTESTAHRSNRDIKCETQETEVRRIPVGRVQPQRPAAWATGIGLFAIRVE